MTIIIIGCLFTLASIWVFGVNRNSDIDLESFTRYNLVCKIAVVCLMIFGWLLGDPAHIDGFANGIKSAGVFWFAFGVIHMILMIYCMLTETNKKILASVMKFGTGNLIFGFIVATAGWLLWG